MAIDDNTSYGLTGAQVKDLASKINAKEDSADLAAVAESGDYTDLINTPTIPTKTSDLTNDGSDNTSVYVEADELATVATSGDYDDLLNKPTIPAAQVNSDWNSNSGVSEILNKPSLATVATSGSYSDLTDKPTIPTVNDATLTITQNGTSAGTFTANASSNTTIALTDTTYSAFGGATSSVAGSAGLVPAPTTSDPDKFLKGDGTWGTPADAGGVFDCYVNKTLAGSWTGRWPIYDSTSYTTQLDSMDISNQLLAGKRVIVHTSDSSPYAYTFEIISQYDDSVPCYDFIVSFGGVLKRLHYVKVIGWEFTGDVVNDATLTIQHNGTTVDTFTANASANKTVNIETIYADTITPTTAVATIGTTQIADHAVTPAKLSDTGWVQVDSCVNTTYFAIRSSGDFDGHIYYRVLGGVVYWRGAIYCHTAPNADQIEIMSNIPAEAMPTSEHVVYGSLHYINNSDYSLWLETVNNVGRAMIHQIDQNVPVASQDWQCYNLGQINYISKDY